MSFGIRNNHWLKRKPKFRPDKVAKADRRGDTDSLGRAAQTPDHTWDNARTWGKD